MSAIMHYVPNHVTCTLCGFYTVEGYVDGTFISITKDTKPYDVSMGMDGEVARVYRKHDKYTIHLTLAQSSVTNNVLTALYNIDSTTGFGRFPIFIKDGSGTTSFLGLTAWVSDIPEVSFSNSMEVRTWTIEATQATLIVGGNGDGSDIENALAMGTSFLPILREFGVF